MFYEGILLICVFIRLIVIYYINFIFESFFDMMDEMLDHEGSTTKWEKFLNNEIVSDKY